MLEEQSSQRDDVGISAIVSNVSAKTNASRAS
jgi:hypothetical protein